VHRLQHLKVIRDIKISIARQKYQANLDLLDAEYEDESEDGDEDDEFEPGPDPTDAVSKPDAN
jgi:hypothetical protein